MRYNTGADRMPLPPDKQSLPRLVSIDAYRGFVMLLLLGEALRLREVARALPESRIWQWLAHHQTHATWSGCSLHDLIQPSFSFLVGVALPFSLAGRQHLSQARWKTTAHAWSRALILVLLGIFLRSMEHPLTYWTFEDTLTQIGLGYGFLFLLAKRPTVEQVMALVGILTLYWGFFALYPAPDRSFDWAGAGVPGDWPHHYLGFASHWNINSNAAWAFDRWFLNLFPREKPFVGNPGGYVTLSFIPTLGTMILGLFAGNLLRNHATTPLRKIGILMSWATLCLALGLILHVSGVCPIVKKIWTPSWVLFSGAWCFLLMAIFQWAFSLQTHSWLALPLVVVGTNSIAAYCMEWIGTSFVRESLVRHLPGRVFELFGAAYAPLVLGLLTLAILWSVLFAMYKKRIFLKI